MTDSGKPSMTGDAEDTPPRVHPMRITGRVALGVALGLTLVPALFELAKVAGAITAFKYQGF